mmetsp:Transcript_59118/g.95554  ORF Transcript_59118/g.95554 Transcript_59118/m.95554 type:complete len:81 (+) Transcript_59118:11-253(+)
MQQYSSLCEKASSPKNLQAATRVHIAKTHADVCVACNTAANSKMSLLTYHSSSTGIATTVCIGGAREGTAAQLCSHGGDS